eukprot:6460860-Amphidinium_carterae.2
MHEGGMDGFFPLQVPAVPPRCSPYCARAVRQRINRKQHRLKCVADMMSGLNALAGVGDVAVATVAELSEQSAKVWRHCYRIQSDGTSCDCEFSTNEALQTLLGHSPGMYGCAEEILPLRPYDKRKISWPPCAASPRPLASSLEGELHDIIVSADERLVRQPCEVALMRAEGEKVTLHHDRCLGRWGENYNEFINEAIRRGVVVCALEAQEEVTAFFVAKKSPDEIRLVLDCRASNQWFTDPPSTQLFTGASLGQLEIGEGQVYIGSLDVKSAFYQHALPPHLRKYFGLPRIRTRDAGITHVEGRRVKREQWVVPQIAVTPMGWKWGLHVVQCAHMTLLSQKIPRNWFSMDFAPPPLECGSCMVILYVDNVIVLGYNTEQVREVRELALNTLESSGLPCHDELHEVLQANISGVSFDGSSGVVKLSDKRFMRLTVVLEHILRHNPPISSRQLEGLVDHITFACLVKRPCLSVFKSVYEYIAARYEGARPLWPSVMKELAIFSGLLAFLRADTPKHWTPRVIVTDACESGHASVSGELKGGELAVGSIGRWPERWRYKHTYSRKEGLMGPRARVLDSVLEGAIRPPQELENLRTATFPEVPLELVRGTEWNVVRYTRLHDYEAMHCKECRGLVKGFVEH